MMNHLISGHSKSIGPRSVVEVALTALTWLMPLIVPRAEPLADSRYTEKSFLFLWPGQSPSAATLNLDSPILTDRPNFTEASRTVGRGVTQVELGYTYTYDGSSAPHRSSHIYPEAALRQGLLADWFELRLGQSLITNDTEKDSTTALGDSHLGVKLGLVPQYGVLPELSVVPSTSLPTGSGPSSSDHALPGFNLVYLWSLSQTAYLSGTTKVYRTAGDVTNNISTTWAQSSVLGSRISESVSFYIEWYGLFQDSLESEASTHFTDTGLTYLYSKNIQYDIRFGTRLQGRFGEDVFAGFGVSRRFL